MDIYYNPENFGLVQVVSLEDATLSYEFDIFCIWQHKSTGKLYWARDSGCSCPSPFEDYTSVDTLNNIHAGSWDDFVSNIERLGYATQTEIGDTIRKVKELLDEDFSEWARMVRKERGLSIE